MFDFLRNLTKSAAEKRHEQMTAYLDESLSPSEHARFEAELAQDATLQADLERERAVKQALSQLPQRRTPRNFTLDPALYGRPAKQPLIQAYPVLRAATGLTAVFFIFAIFAGLYTGTVTRESASDVAYFSQPQTVEATRVVPDMANETTAGEGEAIEVTRIVTEIIVETVEVEAESVEEEAPAAEEEEMAAEEIMEEEASSPQEDAAAQEPIATNSAPPSDSLQGESSSEVVPTATAIATTTPLPTATPALPRITPTSEVAANRVTTPTLEESDSVAGDLQSDDEIADTATAVPAPDQDDQAEQVPARPVNVMAIIVIGLFLLFIVLLATTLYVRRQL